MMSVAAWFGVIGGLAAAAQIVATVSRRVQRVRASHVARVRQVAEASRNVRERAKATLELRREERSMEVELADLTEKIEEGEKLFQQKRNAETQLYMFDERRNLGDHAFIVSISHPRFADIARMPPDDVAISWAAGRRYLVWAANAKTAVAKANMRFGADKGYSVGKAEAFAGSEDDL